MAGRDPGPGWGLVLGSAVGAGVGAVAAVELTNPSSHRLTMATYLIGATVGGVGGLLLVGRLAR